MKLFNTFSLFLLIGLAVTAPAPEKSKESKENVESKESKESSENEKITVTEDFFQDYFIVYRGKHEIVNIIVPLNSLNFNDDAKDNKTSDNSNITLFFVEADVDAAGNRIYKGLYVLKDGQAKKILSNGRDTAASSDDSKDVFFGAKDGIYKYDPKKTKAVKYGTVTDSIIGIAKENATDVIYILTEDHDLYKVTEEGTKKAKIDDVVGPREIVLDNSNNLYFYGVNKKPYVVNADGVIKIEGLPENPTSVRLIKPPFILENGVAFTSDNVAYLIYPNGTSERTDFDFKSNAKPSAYGMEAALIQYYGYRKNIYEYNIPSLVVLGIIDDLENKAPTIQTLATRSRSSLRAY